MKKKNSSTTYTATLKKFQLLFTRMEQVLDDLPARFKTLGDRVDSITEMSYAEPVIPPREDKPMTVGDLCEYLDCAASTIYGKVIRNEIPHHREPNGRRLYFFKTEIDNWVKGEK